MADCPAEVATDAGVTDTPKSATPADEPSPDRATDWGLPVALSDMLTAPFRTPEAVGAKVTLNVQLAPTATLLPQLLVSAKSPVTETLVIVSAAAPVLLKVIDFAELVVPTVVLAKFNNEGFNVTDGEAVVVVPLPVRVILWGLPEAVSVTLTSPVRVPAAVGVKVT